MKLNEWDEKKEPVRVFEISVNLTWIAFLCAAVGLACIYYGLK